MLTAYPTNLLIGQAAVKRYFTTIVITSLGGAIVCVTDIDNVAAKPIMCCLFCLLSCC